MSWLLVLLACATAPEAPAPAPVPDVPEPPPASEVAVPESPSDAVVPHQAEKLGVLVVWNKTEKSRDSHSLGTRIRVQDHEVSVTYSASGRARGRARDPLRFRLTDEQLDGLLARIDELGLLEPRDVEGASTSRFTTVKGTCTVFTGGETRKTSIEAKPAGAAPPSLGTPAPPPAEARDDPAYKAVRQLMAYIERLGSH